MRNENNPTLKETETSEYGAAGSRSVLVEMYEFRCNKKHKHHLMYRSDDNDGNGNGSRSKYTRAQGTTQKYYIL